MEVSGPRTSYTPREEIANAVTHGLGAVLAVTGLVILVAVTASSPRGLVASVVYGASLVLLYTASTLYHALSGTRAQRALRKLDHSAIYALIAGTYTPFALVGLDSRAGWLLFAGIWSLAVLGIGLTLVALERSRPLGLALYLVMGWLVVTVANDLLRQLETSTLLLLLAGGLVYTGGLAFYAIKRPYLHAIWHTCVLTASTLHFFAVLGTVMT